MTGYLTDNQGKTYGLPTLLGWEVIHGLGQPCDSFSVEFLYTREMLPVLKRAVGFTAYHDGEQVFQGVVDEYTVTCDVRGSIAKVEGRSLGALLMDNEAESGEYCNVGLDYILQRHVTPWGITAVETAQVPKLARFTVSSGQSQWSVLREFLQFTGELEPRFDVSGKLLIDGKTGGRTYTVGKYTPVSSVEFREDRYGVISKVLVKKDRVGSSTVSNDKFLARGGKCRRVVNVPRYLSYDAMRYTGEYQIRQSQKDSVVCVITLPELFAAFAGDTVALDDTAIGLTGKFRVSQSRCWAEAGRFGTELTLAVWEEW